MNGDQNIHELAPSWMPRQRRRRIDRELHRLLSLDTCSICKSPLKHNSRTASGLDAKGNAVVAGECCMSRVTEVFGLGLYCSQRQYDFPTQGKSSQESKLTDEQILDAIALTQSIIADADKRLDGIERRGGIERLSRINPFPSAWKDDDRNWFDGNPARTHRVRMPFPGEADDVAATTPAGHALIMLVRQVEPGSRIKATLYLNANLLPAPDNEAVAHALFEIAVGHEPMPRVGPALEALVEKYSAGR
jgi:hypothetical protein